MRDDLSKAVHIAAGKSNDMRIFEFLFSSYSDIIDVNYQSEKVSVIKLQFGFRFLCLNVLNFVSCGSMDGLSYMKP